MGYINTGGYRCTTVTVDKKDADGASLSGYPTTVSFLDAFASEPAITELELRQMSDTAYQSRLTAFKNYLEGEHTGLDHDASLVSGSEPYGSDSMLCPVNAEYDPIAGSES